MICCIYLFDFDQTHFLTNFILLTKIMRIRPFFYFGKWKISLQMFDLIGLIEILIKLFIEKGLKNLGKIVLRDLAHIKEILPFISPKGSHLLLNILIIHNHIHPFFFNITLFLLIHLNFPFKINKILLLIKIQLPIIRIAKEVISEQPCSSNQTSMFRLDLRNQSSFEISNFQKTAL